MCGGYKNDVWGLWGKAVGHPRFKNGHKIMVSCPVELDEENLTFKTFSGSHYKIESFQTNKEKIIEQIKKDIVSGGYERH